MPCFLSPLKKFFVTLTNSLGILPLLYKFTLEICKGLNSGYGLGLDKQLPGKAFQQELFRQKSFWLSLTFSLVSLFITHAMVQFTLALLRELQGHDLKETVCSYQSNLVLIF